MHACFADDWNLADVAQLSREEEAAIGEEKEVRKEDQDRINRFSRLHSRQKLLEDELKTKQVRVADSQPAQYNADNMHRKTRKI